jgi:hypothetical protein
MCFCSALIANGFAKFRERKGSTGKAQLGSARSGSHVGALGHSRRVKSYSIKGLAAGIPLGIPVFMHGECY